MATPSRQLGPLAFGDFLDHLRRQGFTIGVDHHLRLQRLLTTLSGRCAPQDLKTLLCPVFATSEKEQQLFHRAFDSYFDLFQAPAEPERKISFAPIADGGREELVATPGKSGWRSPLGYTVLAILLTTLAVFAARNPEVRKWFAPTPTPTPAPSVEQPSSPEPSTSTSTAPSLEVSPPETVSPPTPEPTPQQPEQSVTDFVIKHRNAIRIAAVAIPLLCFLIYELIRYRRRKLILERARGRKPPRTWPIAVQAPDLKDYRSERFYRAARGLRRRQVGEFHRLDVARTIAATIEARGYPNFRYRPDSRVPEYLILIDRASWRDHQAALFDALARAMEREGLFVQRYFYDGDPRLCTDDSTNHAVHLTDLQKKYPSHRLLIFGDGEKLIDPVSGRLASWAALLLEWPDRAVLTPEARRDLREKTLADHFILLPATLEGLGELAERFDLPTATEFDSWDQYDEPLPPDPEGSVKIEALRDYLGEEAFQWLCACAVYPELHWDLTLHLGSLPRMVSGQSALISEKNLLRLIRLPWFRAGSMPDELRLQLIGKLEPQRERAVRSAIIELLEKNPAPHGSFAADARRLEIAAQRSWLSRDNRQELRREVKEIRKFPTDDVVRDYALVRFLESAPSSRLAMLLPRQLRKTFYEGGVPALGMKSGVRLLATLATMTAIWLGAMGLLPGKPESNDGEISGRDIAGSQTTQSPAPTTTPITSPTLTPTPTATPISNIRLSITPASLDFGRVALLSNVAQQAAPDRVLPLTIRNTGKDSYTISSIAIVGSQRGVFAAAGNNCGGGSANFQTNERCEFRVRFSPNTLGTFRARLLIKVFGSDKRERQWSAPIIGIGGNEPQSAAPTIINFSASPANVVAGEQITLCYGVRDAVEARITPGNIYGGLGGNNCYAVVAPSASGYITYTLTAKGRDGQTVSQQARVRVRNLLPVEIIYFRAQPATIAPGGRAQLCYGVTNARAARIEPDVGEIKPSEKDCVYIQPKQTTTYTLTATGLDGKAETQRFTLRVGTPRK
ncbi:MAG: hypothetical protein AB7U82_21725 [Blastocatellales bacterium]